tara:strand:+ start:5289 stop:6710 length:1422 start_codon:yes stop_codon:yes gene_type:complete
MKGNRSSGSEGSAKYPISREWWAEFLRDLKAAPKGGNLSFGAGVVLPAMIVAVLTGFVLLTNFDLGVENAIYRAGGDSWAFGQNSFWWALYKFGTLPAAVVFVGAGIGYILSWSRSSWRGWRRLFLFCILLLVISSGLIANAGLKEYWGRPRPREVEGLGGHHQFEPVLSIDHSSSGKSFPCGHATTGFYFLGGFFLLRRHRRSLARFFLATGVVYGGLMGVARMVQGAHFFSDVVWACAVCYFTAIGLYYAMGLHKGLWKVPKNRGKMPVWLRLITILVAIAGVAGVLLASPYRQPRNLYLLEDFSKEKPLRVLLSFTVGAHEIKAGDTFHLTGEAYGHGVPTSMIAEFFNEEDLGEVAQVVYHERLSGFLTEVNEQLEIQIPWQRTRILQLDAGKAQVWFELAATEGTPEILLNKGEEAIHFKLEGQHLLIQGGDGVLIEGRELLSTAPESEADYILRIGKEFQGRVIIEK